MHALYRRESAMILFFVSIQILITSITTLLYYNNKKLTKNFNYNYMLWLSIISGITFIWSILVFTGHVYIPFIYQLVVFLFLLANFSTTFFAIKTLPSFTMSWFVWTLSIGISIMLLIFGISPILPLNQEQELEAKNVLSSQISLP